MKHVGDAALDFYCRPNLSWTRGEGGVWGTLEVSLGCKPGKRGKPEGNPVLVQGVTVEIVLPAATSGANLTTSAGKMVFDAEEKKLLWVAGNLRREDVLTLRGPVYLQPGSAVPSGFFGGDLRGRVVDLREGGVRAAGGKRVRTGRGEDQCAANEGRVQLDVVGDEDFAERVVRCADVILKGAGAVDLVFIVFGSVLVVSLFVCLFVEEAKFTQFILLVDECGSGH